MSGLNYYVLDCETTGLKQNYHEIHELSVIRVTDKAQLTKDVACWYPKRAAYDALKLTHKTMNDLYRGEKREAVVEAFNNMLAQDKSTPAGRVIVAYNGAFDRRMVHALWKSVDQEFPADLWLDPLKMMRKYAKTQNWGKVSLGLGNACDLLGIKKFAEHTAKGDTRRTYFLYKMLMDVHDMDHLPYIETKPQEKLIKKAEISEYDDDDVDSLMSEMDDF